MLLFCSMHNVLKIKIDIDWINRETTDCLNVDPNNSCSM